MRSLDKFEHASPPLCQPEDAGEAAGLFIILAAVTLVVAVVWAVLA